MAVKPIPEGYHSVTPYLVVPGVARLIDFLKQAFGAVEKHRVPGPDGRVMHAEVIVGDSPVMMGEPSAQARAMPAMLHMYVEDVDASYARALAAGAKSVRPPTDEFYGDRMAGVEDPTGNQWWMATHQEDLSPDEMKRREAEMVKKRG